MKNHYPLFTLTFGAMLVAVAVPVLVAQPGMPQPPEPPMIMGRTITVRASGSAGAVANRVSLGVTVSSADQTAPGLFVRQNDVIKHLKDALIADGVKPESISEEPFRLMPNMEYGQAGTRVIGYRLDT